jgi:hypothetical protein
VGLAAVLPNDVLVLETDVSRSNGRVVFWDLAESRVLGSVEAAYGASVVGLPGSSAGGRGHVIVSHLDEPGGDQVFEEYDETGTRLRDVTAQLEMGPVRESLAEGWLLDVGGEPQHLLDGALTASTRPLPPSASSLAFVGQAGTPLADGRRFVYAAERDDTTVTQFFREVDLDGTTLWEGSVEFQYTNTGRPPAGAYNRGHVMTEAGGWMGCWARDFGLGGTPSVTTTWLFRFDPDTGELLATHEYPTSDSDKCFGATVGTLVSDRCGGVYAAMPASNWDVIRCNSLGMSGEIDERYVIDHFGADGIRE